MTKKDDIGRSVTFYEAIKDQSFPFFAFEGRAPRARRPWGFPSLVNGTYPPGPLVDEYLIHQGTVLGLNLGLEGIAFILDLPEF